MDSNDNAFLKQFGKASILRELVETLHPRYKSLPSYNKLFTYLLNSENCLDGYYQNSILDLLLGFNIPCIEERLFPIYWGLSKTFSSFIKSDNFAILPGKSFHFFNFFDEFKIKSKTSSEPLLIATLPTYAFFVPLFISSISLPIFKLLNCYSDNYHLAEALFGPAAIFSIYFNSQNINDIENFPFLFKDELLSMGELINTSKFYFELSQKTSHKKENLSSKSNLEELPNISDKWNLNKSIKLFKDYISLNIPPSEIYLDDKNEPATIPDIINASWFYFLENILPFLLQSFSQHNTSQQFIQEEHSPSFQNESNENSEERRNSFICREEHSARMTEALVTLSSVSQLSFPKSIIRNPLFSEQLTNLCALILRGIETSNIFRKLL